MTDDLRALSEKATPGPWSVGAFLDKPVYQSMSDEWKAERRAEEARIVRAGGAEGTHVAIVPNPYPDAASADAAFIVAAANYVRAVLAAQPTYTVIESLLEDPSDAG